MRGLSLHQPYALLVALGWKTLETRKTRTNHRGPLVICASRIVDSKAVHHFEKRAIERGMTSYEWCLLNSIGGRALCIVDVTGCRPLDRKDEPRSWFYEPDRFAWELARRRCFERPPQVRGMQGLFPCPLTDAEIEQAIFPGDNKRPWQGIGVLAPTNAWMGR
jgi:hypothetical protein